MIVEREDTKVVEKKRKQKKKKEKKKKEEYNKEYRVVSDIDANNNSRLIHSCDEDRYNK